MAQDRSRPPIREVIRMGLYESFPGQVEDNGSPARAFNVAGRAVRDFNHRSNGRLEVASDQVG